MAVKRVLPVIDSVEKARIELFDKQLSFSPKQQKLHEQLVVSDDVVLAILGDDSQEVAQRDSERDSQRDSRRSAPRSSDSAHSNTSVGTHIKSHNKSPQGSGDRASGVVKKQQGQAQGLDKKNKSDAVYTRASRTKDSAKSAASSAGGTATFGGDLAKTTMKMRMGALVSNQDLDSFKRAERSKRLTREFMEEMQVRNTCASGFVGHVSFNSISPNQGKTVVGSSYNANPTKKSEEVVLSRLPTCMRQLRREERGGELPEFTQLSLRH